MKKTFTELRKRIPLATVIFIVALLCLFAIKGSSQVVTYTPTSTMGSAATNTTSSALSRGSGIISSTSCSGSWFQSSGFETNNANYTDALADNNFWEFSVTPNANYQLNMTQVSIAGLRVSGTGPMSHTWAYRIGSGSWVYDSSTGSSGTGNCSSGGNTYTWNFTDFNSSSIVTFRLISYGATNTGGTFRMGAITLGGTVTASLSPCATPVAGTVANQEAIVPNAATFTLSDASVYTGLQWQVNTGSSWSDIPSATLSTYLTSATTALMNGYQYRVVLTNNPGGCISASNTSTVGTLSVVELLAPPLLEDAELTGTVGVAFDYSIVNTGGPADTYALQDGVLPDGLSLNTSTGQISGTPTSADGFIIEVIATNAEGSGTSIIDFTIEKGTQTLIGFINQTKNINEGSFDLPSTTNAGLSVTYNSSNTSVASALGNTITLEGLGTSFITATQAGNVNWNELNTQIELTVIDGPCGSESFTNVPFNTEAGTGYSANATRTWTGDNGIGWEATVARTDRTMTAQINAGNGPEERTIAMNLNGSLYNTTPVGGGIGVLTFEYARYFSTNSTLTIFINDVQYGSVINVDQPTSTPLTLAINVPGSINIRIQNGAGGVVIDNLGWTCFSDGDPTLSVTPLSLTDFNYIFGSGPSASQILTVSGDNLDGLQDLEILPGDNFEISFDQLTWFNYDSEPVATLENYTGIETPIYVRLKAGLSVGAYNNISNDIILIEGYDLSAEVLLSGNVACLQPSVPDGSISGITPSCGNTSISFSGVAPTDITYYWQNALDGVSTANDASASLDINVTGNYFVRAKNNTDDCWSEATSGYGVVINTPVNITTQPIGQVVITGGAAVFNVIATGEPTPTYTWQVNTGLGWADASGTNSNSNYNTGATNLTMDGNLYRCIVSNSCNSDTTNEVSLFVNTSPVSIWSNPITNSAPSSFNPFVLDQVVNANITVSGIGRGTGISGNAGSGRYNAAGWNSSSLDANDYFYFILTPNVGYEIDLATLAYGAQASGSGASSFALKSSADGFVSNIGSPSASGSTISLANAALQNLTTSIEFRLYGWNASSGTGTFSVNDFNFTGSVNCIAPLANAADISNTTSESTSVSLTWPSVIDADGYVVVIRNTNNDFTGIEYNDPSSLPTAATAPWNDNDVVYVGSAANALIENLTAGNTYHFKVFAYNNCSSVYKFNNEDGTNNPATFTTNPGNTIEITSNAFGPFCNTEANAISVSFVPTGMFTTDFKVQLSDALGVFPSNTNTNIIGTGATSPISASIPALQAGGINYRIRVVNDTPSTYGASSSSDIIINSIPTIDVQPIDQLTSPTSLAGFTVSQVGGDEFVWEEQLVGEETWTVITNGGLYSNANTAALSIINPELTMSGNKYRCTVSNDCGSIISNEATLTVTIQPISLWANEITGSHPGGSATPYTQGQTNDLNITVSGIGKSGVLPSGSPSDNRYNTQSWENAAVDLNKYIFFTLDANDGYEINFAALSMNVQRSGTGPASFVIRSSQNNFTTNIGAGIYNAATTNHIIDLTAASFQSVEDPITFRLYAYGASGATGTFSINDFNFTGNIGIICNPPTSLNVIASVTTAYLDWEAPGFLPLNGYGWEVRSFPQGVLKASGNTTLTSADANGLTAGTDYRLTVFSRCGGDFESDRSYFLFNTNTGNPVNNDSPAINNPNLSSVNYVYPNCFQITGSTVNSTPTSIFENAETGVDGTNDVWYQFQAISEGVSIKVSSTQFDAKIYLFDANDMTTAIDEESIVDGPGTEVLNFGNLVAGNRYRIAIASADATDGAFNLCVQQLRAPRCTAGSNIYDLCNTLSASVTGAVTTTFGFTSGESTTYATSTGPLALGLPSLQLWYGGDYELSLTANYALKNGLNQDESIAITNNEACTISIIDQPTIVVRGNQSCPATLYRTSYLQGVAPSNVCGVTGYRVEFTQVSNCEGDNPQVLETFSKTISGTSPLISLSYAFNQLIPNSDYSEIGYWSVRWLPRFGTSEGEYGEAKIIAVNGTSISSSSMITAPTVVTNMISDVTTIEAVIYPNPNNGQALNLNIQTGSETDISMRIIDSMGRVVYTNRYQVDVALNSIINFEQSLAAGLYLVEFSSVHGVATQRMLVSK